MAAAAAIAEKKGAMEKVFETSLNVKGGYAVNFFALGVPHTVVVDDIIPFYGGDPMFAGLSNDSSLWPMILEKSFAKMQGNFKHIEGGWMNRGVRYLMGSPWDERKISKMTVEELWDYMSTNLSAGGIMNASSVGGSDKFTDKWGIVKGHAYTVSKVIKLEDGTKLVRARNPWGYDSYMGQYGAGSPQA